MMPDLVFILMIVITVTKRKKSANFTRKVRSTTDTTLILILH